MNTRAKGLAGERRAEAFLVQQGYRVLARNFRTRRGEVDLIVANPSRLAFVEVKSWDALGRDSLGQAVGAAKQRRIVEVARSYLARHPRSEPPAFDVILLRGEEVLHLQDAFDGVA
jgi:putative endonuclease